MTTAQYTRGPWNEVRSGQNPHNVILGNNGNTVIAFANSGKSGNAIAHAEAEANARLIAAAPELLEVAEIDDLLGEGMTEETASRLKELGWKGKVAALGDFAKAKRRAAIAKARGEA